MQQEMDQAAGLRRIFRRRGPLVISLTSTGRDHAKHALHSIRRLRTQGLPLAVLDEGVAEQSLATLCGMNSGVDLLRVVDGKSSINDVFRPLVDGIGHLPVAALVHVLPCLDNFRRQHIIKALAAVQRRTSMLIVRATPGAELSPFVFAASRHLLVIEATATGVTEAVKRIKSMAAAGATELYIATAKSQDGMDANNLYANLQRLLQARIRLPLIFLGRIEFDDLGSLLIEEQKSVTEAQASDAFFSQIGAWDRASVRSGGF